MIKTRTLGRTGLRVSEIGFGGWAIGGSGYGPTNDDESLDALAAAWEKGINFYDTADTYGHGHSEMLLARFIKGKPREKIIIASKAGWDFYHGASKKNFDPDYIRFACGESLKRLECGVIDVYQLHNPKVDLIKEGAMTEALEALKKAGKIRFLGISVHTEEEALAAIHDGRFDTIQLAFNMLDQRMAAKIFDLAFEKKTGIIAREPLACGLLSGKYKPGHQFHREDHRRRWLNEKLEHDLKKVEKLKSVLSTQRLSLARAALEYVLDFDAVSTVIPGAKTRTQVLENIQASANRMLRIEESHHLRDLYTREEIFKKFL